MFTSKVTGDRRTPHLCWFIDNTPAILGKRVEAKPHPVNNWPSAARKLITEGNRRDRESQVLVNLEPKVI